MNNSITVRITKNYGVEAIYPTDEAGLIFTGLTGKKTFSRHDIQLIKNLGYEVQVEAPAL